jgi:hypothetical protein
MSKTKEYIEDMMIEGVDLLSVDNSDYDAEYMAYMKSLEEMNKTFSDEETESKTTEDKE